MDKFGVLYVAVDGFAQQEALRSCQSLHYFNPGIRTAIAIQHGAYGSALQEFDYVLSMKGDGANEYARKVRGLSLSPFDVTLFLDAATHIRGDVMHMSKLLGGSAIAACSPGAMSSEQAATGVLLYHPEKAAAFLSDWLSRLLGAAEVKADERYFQDMIRQPENSQKLKLLPSNIYNCQDEDIWAAIVNGKIDEAIILNTHNWEALYSAVPIEQRLYARLNTIHDFTTATFERVNTLKSEGKHWEAIACLQAAIVRFPYMHFLVEAAHLWWQAGDHDNAACFDRVTALEPRSGYCLARQADYLSALGRREEAVRAARKARSLDPSCQLSDSASALLKAG